MDPQLMQELMAYYASDPAFASEYQRVQAAGETRTPAEWLYDHVSTHPEDLQKFQTFVSTGASGQDNVQPLEQDLLGQVVDRGYADLARDPARRDEYEAYLRTLQPAYDNNAQLANDIAGGGMLTGEQNALGVSTAQQLANLQEQLGTMGPAQQAETLRKIQDLEAYRTGVTGNIDADIAARQAGLDPLKAQRLNAAGTAEAAVNLGVQSAQDDAQAQDALKGFVGGSSTLDQALARAAITGRQQAAGIRGDATVANATDQYGLDTYGAGQRRTLADTYSGDTRGINDAAAETARLLAEYGAGETRTIKDANATGTFGLKVADNNRRIASVGLPTALANDWVASRSAGDEYANSGMNRFLNQLNWFGNGTAEAPVGGAIQQQANDTGLGDLGAGIAGLGTNLLLSQAWKNTFAKTPTPYSQTTAGMLAAGAPTALAVRSGL